MLSRIVLDSYVVGYVIGLYNFIISIIIFTISSGFTQDINRAQSDNRVMLDRYKVAQ